MKQHMIILQNCQYTHPIVKKLTNWTYFNSWQKQQQWTDKRKRNTNSNGRYYRHRTKGTNKTYREQKNGWCQARKQHLGAKEDVRTQDVWTWGLLHQGKGEKRCCSRVCLWNHCNGNNLVLAQLLVAVRHHQGHQEIPQSASKPPFFWHTFRFLVFSKLIVMVIVVVVALIVGLIVVRLLVVGQFWNWNWIFICQGYKEPLLLRLNINFEIGGGSWCDAVIVVIVVIVITIVVPSLSLSLLLLLMLGWLLSDDFKIIFLFVKDTKYLCCWSCNRFLNSRCILK